MIYFSFNDFQRFFALQPDSRDDGTYTRHDAYDRNWWDGTSGPSPGIFKTGDESKIWSQTSYCFPRCHTKPIVYCITSVSSHTHITKLHCINYTDGRHGSKVTLHGYQHLNEWSNDEPQAPRSKSTSFEEKSVIWCLTKSCDVEMSTMPKIAHLHLNSVGEIKEPEIHRNSQSSQWSWYSFLNIYYWYGGKHGKDQLTHRIFMYDSSLIM